ncbi:MAG: ornithine cyclodeaminase family protein [Saprospiraceae bacterium]|nr:ornithine cyclodeaminase family protein [Saprospiraceae bacterium]MCB9321563.1 ornithine cyclodeaminase family protein [Lewinellaceae bacterium]
MTEVLHINDQQLESALSYSFLIKTLKEQLPSPEMHIPPRQHLDIGANTLLLMPAWNEKYIGVKMVTIFPENKTLMLPSIQGTYTLMDRRNGSMLATMDAKLLTNLRTAATSALMAGMLARKDSRNLAMMGTGSLAPQLIRAHCSQFPIEKVSIWGRNPDHAKQLAERLPDLSVDIVWTTDLERAIREADIISTATMSGSPLVSGTWVQPGTHIDAVGSYKPNLRELDDALIRKSAIYVDTIEGATKESGDLAIPLRHGVIRTRQIRGTLFDLCRGTVDGRVHDKEITLFKSVGHASEDLIAAGLAYEVVSGLQ